ncbi:MAG TPA: DinB family protein [Acidobacteriaceae bacterium]
MAPCRDFARPHHCAPPRWVSLLESLSDNDFQRGYEHPESGRQNLAQVLAHYDWHSRHHTAHITGLRQRMGW